MPQSSTETQNNQSNSKVESNAQWSDLLSRYVTPSEDKDAPASIEYSVFKCELEGSFFMMNPYKDDILAKLDCARLDWGNGCNIKELNFMKDGSMMVIEGSPWFNGDRKDSLIVIAKDDIKEYISNRYACASYLGDEKQKTRADSFFRNAQNIAKNPAEHESTASKVNNAISTFTSFLRSKIDENNNDEVRERQRA